MEDGEEINLGEAMSLMGVEATPRSESCILDLSCEEEDIPDLSLCHHGQTWLQGADYGQNMGFACESCCNSTCEIIARFN